MIRRNNVISRVTRKKRQKQYSSNILWRGYSTLLYLILIPNNHASSLYSSQALFIRLKGGVLWKAPASFHHCNWLPPMWKDVSLNLFKSLKHLTKDIRFYVHISKILYFPQILKFLKFFTLNIISTIIQRSCTFWGKW